MAQPNLSGANVSELLAVGPFLGIDAGTSAYFTDAYHATDSINVVPDRKFLGFVTAKGRTAAFSAAFASALHGFAEFQRVSQPDLFLAAVDDGLGHGKMQVANLGGTPSDLTLPITLSQSLETSFTEHQQWMFLTNNADTPLKIDNSLNVTRWGIAAPSVASMGVGNSASGLLAPVDNLIAGTSAGTTVYFGYTIVDPTSGLETGISPISNATPSAAQQVQALLGGVGGSVAPFVNWYASGSAGGPFYKQNSSPVAYPGTFTIPGTLITGAAQPPTPTYNMLGTYYYLVTFSSSTQESSASGITIPIVMSQNGFAVLTSIPTSSDPQVTARNIYRFGGTEQTIMLVKTIADNTTTEWMDNLADVNITGQTLVVHRDVPQPFFDIAAFKGRIWGFGYSGTAVGEPFSIQGTSDLWYSNYEEPWGFNNVAQVLPVGRNSGGDIGVKVQPLGSILCLLKSQSFWALYGGDNPTSDPPPFQLAPIGCASKKSVATGYGRLFWVAPEKAVYMFDGSNFTNISDNRTANAKSSIKQILDGFVAADFAAAAGGIYDQMYVVSFPTQSITFLYDIPSGQWFKLAWSTDRFLYNIEEANLLIATETNTGTVDNWFMAETDLGSPITSSYISRITDSGAPQATKRYRYAVVLAPVQSGATATVTVTVNPGALAKTTTKTVSLSSTPIKHILSMPPTMIGDEVQVTIAVTSSQETEIHRCSVYGWIERQFIPQG